MALTVAGGLVSVVALAVGWGAPLDPRGFTVNILADLALIGPALLLSNVIVMRIRAARARARIEPLLRLVIQLVQFAVQTTQQACDMLGVEASLDLPPQQIGDMAELQALTLPRLAAALSAARAALPPAEQRGNLPRELDIKDPLQFPRFGMVLRLVRQMDDIHPMPWTISAANIAEDWSDRCGVDFFYYGYLGAKDFSTRDRKVGLTKIHQDSVNVLQGRTDVSTAGYLDLVDQCLARSEAITTMLTQDLPESLRQ